MNLRTAACFGKTIQLPVKPEFDLIAIVMAFNNHGMLALIENLIPSVWEDGGTPPPNKLILAFPQSPDPELLISVNIANQTVDVEKGGRFPMDSWERELEINLVGHLESIFNLYRTLH